MNVKPEDLAFVTGATLPECAGNVGAVVKVLDWSDVGNGWLIETRGRPLLGWSFLEDRLVSLPRIVAYDEHLRPIPGEPERESIPTHESTPEHA